MLTDNSPASSIGVQIDDYQTLGRVARGPRAEVWRARAANGREVALKIFHAEITNAPNFIFRFEKETAALSALTHPNVVRVLDRGRSRGRYYLASEWLGNTSLKDLTTPISAFDAANIGVAVCDVLDYAHRRGLPHRSLSLENVFWDAAKHVRVSDFGLARLETAEFAADEARTDLYALGVLLFRLVCGKSPTTPLLLPSKLVPAVSKRFDEAIARALAEPKERFGRASEMSLALKLVTAMSNGAQEKVTAGGFSFVVDGRVVSVTVSPDATSASCEAGAQELGKLLSQPGPWRVAYDFGNLLQLDNGIQALILRLHLRHQKNLERVAFYSPRSLVRSSALVVGSTVKRLPWKSFAGEALMRSWLEAES